MTGQPFNCNNLKPFSKQLYVYMMSFSDEIKADIHFNIHDFCEQWDRDNLLKILKGYKRTKMLGYQPQDFLLSDLDKKKKLMNQTEDDESLRDKVSSQSSQYLDSSFQEEDDGYDEYLERLQGRKKQKKLRFILKSKDKKSYKESAIHLVKMFTL